MSSKKLLPVVTYSDEEVGPDSQRIGMTKGPVCDGCSLSTRRRLPGVGYEPPIHIMRVSESPTSTSLEEKTHFAGKGGRVIVNTWKKVIDQDNKANGGRFGFSKLRTYDTYAVQCQADDPDERRVLEMNAKPGDPAPNAQKYVINQAVIDRCSHYLKAAIRHKKPRLILAFGATALKAVGIRSEGKFEEVRGRILHVNVGGETYLVMPTFSTKALVANAGLYNLFYSDVVRAMRIASGHDEAQANTNVREVAKDYYIPGFTWGPPAPEACEACAHPFHLTNKRCSVESCKCEGCDAPPNHWEIKADTADKVVELIEQIENYSGDGSDPSKWAISVDTETNTLDPHRTDAKVLCVSFAWDSGKSTTIPLWHKDAAWTEPDLEKVVSAVRRLLASPKPKIFHNAKFDVKFLEQRHGFQVNNIGWCTLGGEHLIEPEQQGSYSLKVLGRSYFPQFANYADRVHDLAVAATLTEPDDAEAVAASVTATEYEKPTKKHIKSKRGESDPDMAHALCLSKREYKEYLKSLQPQEEADPTKAKKKKRRHAASYEEVPIADLLLYGALDTDLTRKLLRHQFQRAKLSGFAPKCKELMKSHVVPVSRTLGKMEFYGTRIDQPYLNVLDEALQSLVAQKFAEVNRHWDPTWGPFNPNSVPNIQRLLYSGGVLDDSVPGKRRLRIIPDMEKNANGTYKTDKKTLRAIVEYTKKTGKPCPVTIALLDYRAAHKGTSGFLADIRALSAYDGRLHTNFHIVGTATGRLSSSGMNLQNWPSKIAGHNLKKLIIPDDPADELIVNLDYKGAEVKIFAAYSKDPRLIEALLQGLDTHCYFVSQIYDVPYEEALSAQEDRHPDKKRAEELKSLRTIIKRVVFGILYGAGPKKIAETAGVTLEKAQETIEQLQDMFPSIRDYVDDTKDFIRKNGYVETFFGRRRQFQLHAVNSFFRSQAERRGVNMKIQSTSSDIVMSQLVELDQHIGEVGGRLALTVHDSMVAVVKKKYADQLPDLLDYYCVKRVSEKYPWLPVPFSCDIEVGPSYGECVPLDKYLAAGVMADEYAAMPEDERSAKLGALKTGKHPLYKALEVRLPDALRARAMSTDDLAKRLEEQFDEEAIDELRDLEEYGAPTADPTA